MTEHTCCTGGCSSYRAPAPLMLEGERRRPALARRWVEAAGWLVPSAVLALVPKCPACLAAYVALGTGATVSVSTAGSLRMALIACCGAALGILAVRRMRRFRLWRSGSVRRIA